MKKVISSINEIISKSKVHLTKEKLIWIFLIVFTVGPIYCWFDNAQLIPTSQVFGPSSSSRFGRAFPFSDFNVKFSCQPKEPYFSEDSDLSCKFLTKKKQGDSYNLKIAARIYVADSNRTFWNCESSIISAGGFVEKGGPCKDSAGNVYFELPKGDYKISASKFSESGGVTVTVETDREVIFRETLHVMSSYEKANKQAENGVWFATFIALLFLIPTAFIEFRHFLYEG